MIYISQIRLWRKQSKRSISKSQNAAVLNGIVVFFISTRSSTSPPLFTVFVVGVPDFRQVRFFNVKYRRYLSLFGGRSPPSVLVFLQKNQNGGLTYEKSQFAGLLPVLYG